MNEFDAVRIIAQALYNYSNHTQEKMTYQVEQIAELQLACAKLRLVNKLSIQYIKQFFDERKITQDTIMTALDTAIQSGDTEIADIALELLANEYGKNPIRTIRCFKEG